MSAAVQILLAVFALLLVLGVPISMALLLAASAAMLAAAPVAYDLTQIPLQLAETTGSFPLLAIPFFVLAGNIMSRGGMSERLIDLARSMVSLPRPVVAGSPSTSGRTIGYPVCRRNCMTPLRGRRRCPPAVRIEGTVPLSHQRLSDASLTPMDRATCLGVSKSFMILCPERFD